jgi:hypothetical protein
MRLSKKNFSPGKGKYYFTIKSLPNNITIYRKDKAAAASAYKRYQRAGKEIEWLGKWDGKKFTESSPPSSVAA